jgi:hypothetical protein
MVDTPIGSAEWQRTEETDPIGLLSRPITDGAFSLQNINWPGLSNGDFNSNVFITRTLRWSTFMATRLP